MNPKSIDEFQSCCRARRCPRATIITPRCELESKQTACYAKYIKKLDRDKGKKRKPIRVKRDTDYEDFVREVWLRQTGSEPITKQITDWRYFCQFWAILSPEEKNQFQNKWGNNPICQHIDVAHIESKGVSVSKKYDPDNGLLINRLCHSLLDTHSHPLSGEFLDKEARNYWFQRIKQGTNPSRSNISS